MYLTVRAQAAPCRLRLGETAFCCREQQPQASRSVSEVHWKSSGQGLKPGNCTHLFCASGQPVGRVLKAQPRGPQRSACGTKIDAGFSSGGLTGTLPTAVTGFLQCLCKAFLS